MKKIICMMMGLAVISSLVVHPVFAAEKEDYSKKSVDALIVAAKSSDGVVRAQAVAALGTKGAQASTVVPVLMGVLKDPKPYIRNIAMNALAKIGQPAVPALIEGYETGDKTLQFYAANALKKIGTPKAMEVYKAYVAKGGK